MKNPKYHTPNSLLIFIFSKSKNLDKLFNIIDFHEDNHLDNNKIFGKFEKKILLRDHPLSVRNENFSKFPFNVMFINNPKISIELFRLYAKEPEDNKRNSVYFIKIDIYYRYFQDYFNFIKEIQEDKNVLFDFIQYIIDDAIQNSKDTDHLKLIMKFKDNIHFIHFNLLFYNYKEKSEELISIYKTGKIVIKEPQLEIYFGLSNNFILYINRIKQQHSANHLKVYATRFFLVTLFAWFNRTMLKLKFTGLNKDFLSYYKYLTHKSTRKDIYLQIIKLPNYSIAFNIGLAVMDAQNQTAFLKSESSLKTIMEFIKNSNQKKIPILKFIFVTDKLLRDHKATFNFLEKNGWYLIYCLKYDDSEKRDDYDTEMQNFIGQLSMVYSHNWSQIYVISSDTDWAKYFLNNLTSYENMILFLNDNNNLREKMGLRLVSTLESVVKVNIYQK